MQQLQPIRVPAVHALGIHGQGVLVAHFDTGYALLTHEAFSRLHVVAQRDFVDHDDDPTLPADSLEIPDEHGMETLSSVAGFAPGQLIGAAYDADYALARTELAAVEVPAEEDNWIAAAEWADSLGADVITSSLKFFENDPPYPSYTWQDMDGHTALVTRAADLAVARGIVVVNGAGNFGFSATHNTLVAPADGDNVIAAGAVQTGGGRAAFSSVGPTTDVPPRIKPDVMAPGTAIVVARMGSGSDYGLIDGTSLSCPLVAGVAALLLSSHPHATPMQIRDALRLTASRASAPDNLFGWGTVDALAAHRWLEAHETPVTVEELRAEATPERVRLFWTLGSKALRELRGIRVQRADFESGPYAERTDAPLAPSSHMYFEERPPVAENEVWYRLRLESSAGAAAVAGPVQVRLQRQVTQRTTLHPLLEPSAGEPVQIRYSVGPTSASVVLSVFDARGRAVWQHPRAVLSPGEHSQTWDRVARSGGRLPRGVYFVQLRAGEITASRKLLLSRG